MKRPVNFNGATWKRDDGTHVPVDAQRGFVEISEPDTRNGYATMTWTDTAGHAQSQSLTELEYIAEIEEGRIKFSDGGPKF
jgi:hypothetical protein